MPSPDLHDLISSNFDRRHISAALKHFTLAVEAFQLQDWETSIAKTGKFVEATLKALWLHVGGTLPPARQYKAGNVIRDLKQLPTGSFHDSIRLTIPRACEFVYDVASNRGARHDPGEVDPNEMDATAVVGTISWILAELLRYAQKGSLDPATTTRLIEGLVERKYPVVEEVEGRAYFHIRGISARQVALLALWHRHPRRMTREELAAEIVRNNFSMTNANTAIARVTSVVDIDQNAGMRLLRPGIEEAEELIKSSNTN